MTIELKLRNFFIIFILLNNICKVICKSKPRLSLINDGPAVTGANITFFAALSGYSSEQFIYIFEDGIQKAVSLSSESLNVSLSMTFPSDLYAEGEYHMKVTVKTDYIIIKKEIAFNRTSFILKKSLIGDIYIYQGDESNNKDLDEIAVGENFTAVVDLYDPNHYLKDAVFVYSWSFDMDRYYTYNNSFTYNFIDEGRKVLIVKPIATFPDSRSISGFFHKSLTAKVPVNGVFISGDPFLHHGDDLNMTVSCNGTSPFKYCSEVFKDNITADNFTCKQISSFNTCHWVIKKFLTDGNYQLGIYISNDVREIKKIMKIVVYSVSIEPVLSTIIIPVICSFLTVVIIAIGISFYIRQRKQFAVEVADFDFQEESDSYTGEGTFFEKILNSFSCRDCAHNRLSCVKSRSESDPLLDDESLLPYV